MIARKQSVQVSEDVAKHLEEAGAKVKAYDEVQKDLKAIAATGAKLWLDPAKVFQPTEQIMLKQSAFGHLASKCAVSMRLESPPHMLNSQKGLSHIREVEHSSVQ